MRSQPDKCPGGLCQERGQNPTKAPGAFARLAAQRARGGFCRAKCRNLTNARGLLPGWLRTDCTGAYVRSISIFDCAPLRLSRNSTNAAAWSSAKLGKTKPDKCPGGFCQERGQNLTNAPGAFVRLDIAGNSKNGEIYSLYVAEYQDNAQMCHTDVMP